ncbi:MAG: hypothetical protein C0425_11095, partial [Chlorobiaceae bacterium]|nr:hypothetical protein [Chlorobiaceae bacterium]
KQALKAPSQASSSTQQHKTSSRSSSHVTGYDLYHSLGVLGEELDIDDPSLIMPEFMKDNFLREDDVNPYRGYPASFERDLSPKSLGLYQEFERASQNFETLKKEGKPCRIANYKRILAEHAFLTNESGSQLFHAIKDGVVESAEWAKIHPFQAAYAGGEYAPVVGGVLTGGRNVYEVAFHKKPLA